MNTSVKVVIPFLMLLTLFAGVLSLSQMAKAETQHIILDSNGNPLIREEAREQKEQWDATRNLRNKINQRVEKQFDKAANGLDKREACESSLNVNAYWEPKTMRCLDRRTGRPVTP
ncbi:Protein of unknown function [Izhakiella capsodis]|uniref:Uncharacterized protein n=1 Tax=Izhakiella capsodis TaxID=1367852 RepID=A0A1I4VBZ4_9GAMM|nr:DUF1283 family protein [Izhakiella capsodis]SFM98705.1 Protein of unknown function [Izhakiella capsodis]